MPHGIPELENVLRRAAGPRRAGRVPASVHDLLRAVLSDGREAPATALLLRCANDPQQLERWRDEPSPRAIATAVGEVDAAPRDLSPAFAVKVHARLDQLESALHAHSIEMAAERKTILDALGGLQGELQALRTVREQRPARVQKEPADPVLVSKIADIGQGVTALGERLAAFDGLAGATDHWPDLMRRLDSVEGRVVDQLKEIVQTVSQTSSKPVDQLIDRLKEATEAFSKTSSKSAAAVLLDAQGGVQTRLDQTAATLQQLREELERQSMASGERQIALEASLRARLQGAEEAGKAHERDLGEIYEALVKIGTNQQTLGENLNTWRLDTSGDVGILSNRLQQLEQTTRELVVWLGDEMMAQRREGGGDEQGRGNGFKRWLYGTSHVLTGARREVPESVSQPVSEAAPQPASRLRSEDKS